MSHSPETTSFGKRRRGQEVNRNLSFEGRRLPRGRDRSDAVLVAESHGGRALEAEGREKVRAQPFRRGVLRIGIPPPESRDVHLDSGIAARDRQRRRLDHGQRPDCFGSPSRGEQGQEPSVRVADEVSAVVEDFGDVRGLRVEVETLRRRTVAVPLPVDEQQPKLIRELALLDERPLAPAEAAVDEDDRLAVAEGTHVELGLHGPRV